MTLPRRLVCAVLIALTLTTVSGIPAVAEEPGKAVILPPVSCYLYKYYLDNSFAMPIFGGHVKAKFNGYYYGTRNCIGRYRPSTTERAWIKTTHRNRRGDVRPIVYPQDSAVTSIQIIDWWTSHEYTAAVRAYIKIRACFGPLCGISVYKGYLHGNRTAIEGTWTASWWFDGIKVGNSRFAYDRWPIR